MLRVLVVEDSEDDFHFVEVALKQAQLSVDVHWARDGEDGMHFLGRTGKYAGMNLPRPDLVLADLKMPRMSGLDLLAWLQRHPQHQVIPTVMMSSSCVARDVEQAYALGANTYFVKPVSLDTFVNLFRTIAAYWELAIKPLQVSEGA